MLVSVEKVMSVFEGMNQVWGSVVVVLALSRE